MLPGPFTTCRMVQRKLPRCNRLFAQQNTENAVRQLQSCGLGAIVQTRKNQLPFHKPLPTPQNKAAVQKVLARLYSWDDYVSWFSRTATLANQPSLFNSLLLSSPYAAQLKDSYNIVPVKLEPE